MRYRAAAKIPAAWECNLLVVASAHLVLCQVGAGEAGTAGCSCLHAALGAVAAARRAGGHL